MNQDIISIQTKNGSAE